MVTQQEIARRVGLDVSSVNKILNQRVGPRFRKDTVARVLRTARELGFDFGRLKYFHRRRHERQTSGVVADLAVHREDGTLVEAGKGTLVEVSSKGARLNGVSLPSGRLPLFPFVVALRWRKGSKEQSARGRVVRLDLEARGMALEFLSSALQAPPTPAPAGI